MIPLFILLFVLFSMLMTVFILRSGKEVKSGYSLRKGGNNTFVYHTVAFGETKTLVFKGKMYAENVPRHAVYIDADWSKYPLWAIEKRDEIIKNIKTELKAPAYTIVYV